MLFSVLWKYFEARYKGYKGAADGKSEKSTKRS
jgi:hypothetical protein